jgi:hypothetical protein
MFVGTISKVNADYHTCTIQKHNGDILYDVALPSIPLSSRLGILVYPQEGTEVLIEEVNNTPYIVGIPQNIGNNPKLYKNFFGFASSGLEEEQFLLTENLLSLKLGYTSLLLAGGVSAHLDLSSPTINISSGSYTNTIKTIALGNDQYITQNYHNYLMNIVTDKDLHYSELTSEITKTNDIVHVATLSSGNTSYYTHAIIGTGKEHIHSQASSLRTGTASVTILDNPTDTSKVANRTTLDPEGITSNIQKYTLMLSEQDITLQTESGGYAGKITVSGETGKIEISIGSTNLTITGDSVDIQAKNINIDGNLRVKGTVKVDKKTTLQETEINNLFVDNKIKAHGVVVPTAADINQSLIALNTQIISLASMYNVHTHITPSGPSAIPNGAMTPSQSKLLSIT